MLMSKSDWEINIENAANAAAAEYGSSTVKSVFARYDAHGSMIYLLAITAKYSLI